MIAGSILFILIGLGVFATEYNRTKNSAPDVQNLFLLIFSVQIILPGIFLPLLIEKSNKKIELQNIFFDRLYTDLAAYDVLFSAASCGFFIFLVTYFSSLCQHILNSFNCIFIRAAYPSYKNYIIIIMFGYISNTLLLTSMPGDGFWEKYQSLILFRSQDDDVFRQNNTILVALLFALTQSFSLISILWHNFISQNNDNRYWVRILAFLTNIFFALMMGSRRGLIIQFFLILFTSSAINRKVPLIKLLISSLIVIPVLLYGKTVLALISYGSDLGEIFISSEKFDFIDGAIYGLSTLGISLTSSWATYIYMDSLPARYGIDHIVSILRFLPLSSIGIDENALFPQRVVRISTEMFVDSLAQDIPPGLFGQMWLDYGFLGPVIWGSVVGILLGFVQYLYLTQPRKPVIIGIFSIVTYLFALPLNTGSLDFSLSIDIFAICIFFCYIIQVGPSKNPNNK